jgi:hypothetical protein
MTRPIVAALALALAAFAPAPASAEQGCPSAEAAGEPDEKLDHVASALAKGGPIEVLAVGSPGPAGPEGQPQPASLAAKFADALSAQAGGAEVRMRTVGGRGQGVADTLAAVTSALAARHADLVVWQAGTVEAVKGLPPDEFSDALAEAAARVTEADADLVLVDPQYSRFLRANADVEPYEEALRVTAALPSVLLFRRFDVMHEWVDADAIDLERAAKADREALVRHLHGCLGDALATFVLDAAKQPSDAAGAASR